MCINLFASKRCWYSIFQNLYLIYLLINNMRAIRYIQCYKINKNCEHVSLSTCTLYRFVRTATPRPVPTFTTWPVMTPTVLTPVHSVRQDTPVEGASGTSVKRELTLMEMSVSTCSYDTVMVKHHKTGLTNIMIRWLGFHWNIMDVPHIGSSMVCGWIHVWFLSNSLCV